MRKNSFAFCGGAFGDEGKGRIVDEYVARCAKKGPVVVYRDNGGANAGHTIEFSDGRRVALHLLPSGVFNAGATVILGKGMVIHPGDLMTEIHEVDKIAGKKSTAKILIDEMAVLSLDTHRAFETTLKSWQNGYKGSTGRGIAPAYADVLLRHPLRMRDIASGDWEAVRRHYRLYGAFHKGFETDMATVEIPVLGGSEHQLVGSEEIFIQRIKALTLELKPYITDVSGFLARTWKDPKCAYVFEKAQGIAHDPRWGVYPDITASDTTFGGIYSATEGVIDPDEIPIRAGVIKATYNSSVGSRILPTKAEDKLASRIREDAFEYGATTKRPRDIIHIDLPALKFFFKVGKINRLVLTHMDIVYPDVPIKVCIAYRIGKHDVPYRPDQKYLLTVKPVYREFASWVKEKVQTAKTYDDLPRQAKTYIQFLEKELHSPLLVLTTGAKRSQSIYC